MEMNDLIGILVDQNKSFIEQNKNYKDMLFFGVSSIVTILVIFLTANFFTMRKFREEEKEKIKSEVLHQLELDRLPNIEQSLKTQLESLVQEKFSTVHQRVSSLEDSIGKNKRMYKSIEGKIFELNAEMNFKAGIYSTAFTEYISACTSYIEANDFWIIGYNLDDIEKTVALLTSADSHELTRFNDLKIKLPPKHIDQGERIKETLLQKNR